MYSSSAIKPQAVATNNLLQRKYHPETLPTHFCSHIKYCTPHSITYSIHIEILDNLFSNNPLA